MKREYKDGIADNVRLFTGIEIEKTPQYGAWTLFVVGVYPAMELVALARKHNCNHIYLGANHSFDGQNMASWDTMVSGLLNEGFWVTLDFDVKHIEEIHESCYCEHRRFIPVISVKIPYLGLLNYNATLKIDDKDFDATNAGVWCHPVRTLLTDEAYTNWDHYGRDKKLEMNTPNPAD